MSLNRRLDRLEQRIDVNACPACRQRPRVEVFDLADDPAPPPLQPCSACGRWPRRTVMRVLLSWRREVVVHEV
jgi:hypothetical protein